MVKRYRRRGGTPDVRNDTPTSPPAPSVQQHTASAESADASIPALFTLEFSATDGAGAVLPFRWQLTEAGAAALLADTVHNPHLLVFVTQEVDGMNQYREVARLLIPVKKGHQLHYIRFDRPGEFQLRAVLVHRDSKKHLMARFMSCGADGNIYTLRTDGSADKIGRLFSAYTGEPNTDALGSYLGAVERVPITVEHDHFAPPIPVTWRSRLVNMRYSKPPVDECDYRRRVLLLIPNLFLGLLLLLFHTVAYTVVTTIKLACAACALLVGCRIWKMQINFANLDDFDGVFGGCKSSYYTLVDSRGQDLPFYQSVLRTPLLYIISIWVFTYLNSTLIELVPTTWWRVAMLYGVGTVVAFGLLLGLIVWCFESVLPHSSDVVTQQRAQLKMALLQQRRADLETLVGNTTVGARVRVGVDLSLENLPPAERTLRVRYERLKAKVCAPFARP